MNPEIDYAKLYLPILFTKVLSPSAKILFAWYKFRGNSIGVVRWEYEDVARELNLSDRTVRRNVAKLAALGLLRINKADRRGHEVEIMPFSTDVLTRLDAITRWVEARGGKSPAKLATDPPDPDVDRQICPDRPAILSSHIEVVKETEMKPGADSVGSRSEKRIPFDDVFTDPLVVASTKPRQSVAKTPQPRPEPQPVPVVDDVMLARWTAKNWAKAFVAAMEAKGYRVDHANHSKTIQSQITNVTDFLVERIGRTSTYRFLTEFFPDNFPMLCEAVFHKTPQDLANFPISWMSARLGELMEKFKNREERTKEKQAHPSKGIRRLEWLE